MADVTVDANLLVSVSASLSRLPDRVRGSRVRPLSSGVTGSIEVANAINRASASQGARAGIVADTLTQLAQAPAAAAEAFARVDAQLAAGAHGALGGAGSARAE